MFMYDLSHDSLISAGLVAHGSCNTPFLESPVFSDKPGSGCSSPGKYAIGKKYLGRFGKACKLYGLDSTNNNAFTRNVVLLSYYLVTENEVYPLPICSSVGCIMTSPNFLSIVSGYIDVSSKPVLLWVFYKLI